MKTVMTPIGQATLVGLSVDRKRALCMHTRPREERTEKKGTTYARWWGWDGEKCIEEVEDVSA